MQVVLDLEAITLLHIRHQIKSFESAWVMQRNVGSRLNNDLKSVNCASEESGTAFASGSRSRLRHAHYWCCVTPLGRLLAVPSMLVLLLMLSDQVGKQQVILQHVLELRCA